MTQVLDSPKVDDAAVAAALEALRDRGATCQAYIRAGATNVCVNAVNAAGKRWSDYSDAASRRAAAGGRRLLPVLDSGDVDGRFWIAYDVGSARSLADHRDGGRLPTSTAQRVLSDVARALDEAAANGLFASELPPDSVFVTGKGARLGDLGTAREGLAGAKLELEGDPAYVPPEVLKGERAGERSGVYLFGALLHYVLTGAAPERGGSAPRECRQPDLPASIKAVVTTAMADDPDNRPQSVREAHEMAERALRGEPQARTRKRRAAKTGPAKRANSPASGAKRAFRKGATAKRVVGKTATAERAPGNATAAKGASGKATTPKSPSGKATAAKGASSLATLVKRATPKDALGKPATAKRATPKHAVRKAGTAKRATPKRAVRKAGTAKRAISRAATATRAISQAATARRAVSRAATAKRALRKPATATRATSRTATAKRAVSRAATAKRALRKAAGAKRVVPALDPARPLRRVAAIPVTRRRALGVGGALVLGASAGLLLGTSPDPEPARAQTVTAGGLSVTLPSGRHRVEPRGKGLTVRAPGSLLRARIVSSPLPPSPDARPVQLGPLQAWRQSSSGAVRYSVPTSRGTLAITCRVTASESSRPLRLCERSASTLRLRRASALPLAAAAEESRRVDTTIAALKAERDAARARLGGASTPADQRLAAQALRDSHERAATVLRGLTGAGPVEAAARGAADSYSRLAAAAGSGSAERWTAASEQVRRSDAVLAEAVAAVP